MKKILILGNTGMLGSAVERHFLAGGQYLVTTACRNPLLVPESNSLKFEALVDSPDVLGSGYDYVLNCIGVIKPFMAGDPIAAIKINSLLPWKLSRWCKDNNMRLIHITTDCVYSGTKGKYIESDLHDALDDYGKSKSLGECVSEAMVLRTSIIGEEIHKYASLVSWAKSQKGKTVGGFTTHLWNGITTNEYAKVCDKIIGNDWYEPGLFHVFASDDVNKFEMMQLFNKKFDLGLTIEARDPAPLDRTMRTEKELCGKLNIPTVASMIGDM
jgi:dTDP-4-dehydrorhamnose reductase